MCYLVCMLKYNVYNNFSLLFFKQKTAYEMRISDWSSDVCSSDLRVRRAVAQRQRVEIGLAQFGMIQPPLGELDAREPQHFRTAIDPQRLFGLPGEQFEQIGRASCRARVRQYV